MVSVETDVNVRYSHYANPNSDHPVHQVPDTPCFHTPNEKIKKERRGNQNKNNSLEISRPLARYPREQVLDIMLQQS